MIRKGGTYYVDRAILYSSRIGLLLTEADYLKECKRLKVPDLGSWMASSSTTGTVHSLENEDGCLVCLVCVDQAALEKHKYSKDDTRGLLVHEAVHCWQKLAAVIGEYSPGVEEEAYAVERIATRLFAAYKKALKRYRKKKRVLKV